MRPIKVVDMGTGAIKSLFKSFDTVLSDCDGVLWIGDKLIHGAETVLNGFRQMGKRIIYVTNNSQRTRIGYAQKCNHLGIKASKEEIISSSYLVASYLTDIGFKKNAYVFGSNGVTEELKHVGINSNEPGPDPMVSSLDMLLSSNIKLDPEVGAVIVAYDEHISLPKMIKAATYLKDPNCLYIATSTEVLKLPQQGFTIPASGCMALAISCCSGRQPYAVGKPHPYVIDVLLKKFKLNPERTLMIGDTGGTDILLGKYCGFRTLLVLSGVSTATDLEEWQCSKDKKYNNYIPDYYVQSLADLAPFLSN